MKNWGIIIGFFFFSHVSFAQNEVYQLPFEEGKSNLSLKIVDCLDSLYRAMESASTSIILLKGTNEVFSSTSEQWSIYKQRAKVVEKYLEDRFLAEENVYIKYAKMPQLVIYKPSPYQLTSALIDLSEHPSECFTFNGNYPEQLTTSNGTSLLFSRNSFETEDGTLVGLSNLKVCVYEFFTKKDMVLTNLTTHAKDVAIETAGSFFIEVYADNGKKMKLRPGKTFQIAITKDLPENKENFYTFYGETDKGIINWKINPEEIVMQDASPTMSEELISEEESSEMEINYFMEGVYVKSYHSLMMKVSSLGWINCDRFIGEDNLTNVKVLVKGEQNAAVRIVFRDINSVMPAYLNSNDLEMYTFQNIPVGKEVLLLCYTLQGDEVHYAFKELTITKNQQESLTTQTTTKQQFVAMLEDVLPE